MCARFSLVTPAEIVADLFALAETPVLEPRYNVAPTQPAAVVRAGADAERELALLRWGLIPYWAKDRKIGNRMINARSETVATRPAFKSAIRRRRCLVPVDGFYEWEARADGKQPIRIRRRDALPFALAGLWERWKPADGEPVESFAVLTTAPNQLLLPIHDRMPVIIAPADYDRWLDLSLRSPDAVAGLMAPFPDGELEAYPVSRHVNSPHNDDPECIEPAG